MDFVGDNYCGVVKYTFKMSYFVNGNQIIIIQFTCLVKLNDIKLPT